MPSVQDIKLHPTASAVAEEIDSDEAYEKLEALLLNATYEEAHSIMSEAIAFLKAILKKPAEAGIANEGGGHMLIIANLGTEISDLTSALKTVARHVL